MLIRFGLENWMSFRDPVEFSMVASQEQQHGSRVFKSSKYRMRVLPVAAIYGGNASGKSNFFQALKFAKEFIVRGTQPENLIPVDPFRLVSDHSKEIPTSFKFELLLEDMVYEYSFSVTSRKVHFEKLVQVYSTSEKVLFSRAGDHIDWMPALAKDDLMKFSFRGTRENQLFLTNSVSQKVEHFKPIYDWFRNSLVLISPSMRFGASEEFFNEDGPIFQSMDRLLAGFDTGIVSLRGKKISFDDLQLPASLKNDIRERIGEKTSIHLRDFSTGDRILLSLADGEIIAKRLTATHRGRNGFETQFEMGQESDGTLRVIDLLPAFLDLADPATGKTYVIDELDRSLHSLLVRQLLELFLEACSTDTRSQLLFTTHDLLTMDQDLLRRDEMWVVERNAFGESSMIAFSEYKEIRSDKDLRKSYLQGRLGGIPHLTANTQMVKSGWGSGEEE
ncbi:MAG: ATP-binding protein [Krumholzibacteria bacterium]|nr:ATP-binding protein [Candidatus Krumholzibacteria bacterium]